MNRIESNVATGEQTMVQLSDIEVSEATAAKLAYDYDDASRWAEKRALAYKSEADAIFFQEQRGEVPEGTWLAKIQEIKARYPKV